MATSTTRTTGRRRRTTVRHVVAGSTVRVNIVRLIPGKTRLPVGPEPELESFFAA